MPLVPIIFDLSYLLIIPRLFFLFLSFYWVDFNFLLLRKHGGGKALNNQIFFCSVFSPNGGKYGPEKTPYLETFHTASFYRTFEKSPISQPFNPFHVTSLFRYPLKPSENLRFLKRYQKERYQKADIFKGYQKRPVA